MNLTSRDKKLLVLAWWCYMLVVFTFAAVVLYNARSFPAVLLFLALILLAVASIPGLRRSLRSQPRAE